jgi:hypothetical protein
MSGIFTVTFQEGQPDQPHCEDLTRETKRVGIIAVLLRYVSKIQVKGLQHPEHYPASGGPFRDAGPKQPVWQARGTFAAHYFTSREVTTVRDTPAGASVRLLASLGRVALAQAANERLRGCEAFSREGT